MLIKNKISTYLPETSIVGIFMNNFNVKCIKAKGHGFYEHLLVNWYIEDYNLVSGVLSDSSINANKASIYACDNFDIKECKIMVERFFELLKEYKINVWKDLNNINVDDLFTELDKVKVNKEIKRYYMGIFKSMIH